MHEGLRQALGIGLGVFLAVLFFLTLGWGFWTKVVNGEVER